ncbi:MAG: 2-oxo-4-hydroxy-4-carboxy-5-ureidoimidazoline decarboxylase [Gammaproteobacteria bacterium]|nr:2-oxo-4-hydroxy-4-carboxy-5-ureidoimidazoline decarboxylase [Gammaproteobacteria bacterium]MDH5240888.1 2-oxo-4-hydroxy-4-carboxy-5-ureidoimidazoline decarboxylase [Gammaproteobacteria bacterium]MDH5261755.1 2-oxo-4-hydroxy-4-carboxy-5-ureidoimidazoline decarboxylase [Gammaproteobacteria bacterium]MDH5621416.1 2-oxo-4-hydroxy-4-carboxy-5-ureidoimidazoline decarboxylase [Gammaproteobacteria bacterium]
MSAEFVKRYGGIYEHSPWVAEQVEDLLDDAGADKELLASLMADCVDNASPEQQLALIRAHPDLAGKAQLAGELTVESTEEQTSAGLDRCTADEYAKFQSLNATYWKKFDFPFIMAVRNSSRAEILQAFASRIENDYEQEFETALLEIHKIAALRLAALEGGQ